MEGITGGINDLNISDSQKRNRIQVSNTKKPLFFYVNLAKRYMQQYNEVELSALGMAIATVVTVAEILKNNGFAVEKSDIPDFFYPLSLVEILEVQFINYESCAEIRTLTVDMRDEPEGRPVPKAKIEIVLGKTQKFDELMAAESEAREAGDGEQQS